MIHSPAQVLLNECFCNFPPRIFFSLGSRVNVYTLSVFWVFLVLLFWLVRQIFGCCFKSERDCFKIAFFFLNMKMSFESSSWPLRSAFLMNRKLVIHTSLCRYINVKFNKLRSPVAGGDECTVDNNRDLGHASWVTVWVLSDLHCISKTCTQFYGQEIILEDWLKGRLKII